MNAVPPISMATAKPHQKVCDLKIAIVHLHPFVFKKIGDICNLCYKQKLLLEKFLSYACSVDDHKGRGS